MIAAVVLDHFVSNIWLQLKIFLTGKGVAKANLVKEGES